MSWRFFSFSSCFNRIALVRGMNQWKPPRTKGAILFAKCGFGLTLLNSHNVADQWSPCAHIICASYRLRIRNKTLNIWKTLENRTHTHTHTHRGGGDGLNSSTTKQQQNCLIRYVHLIPPTRQINASTQLSRVHTKHNRFIFQFFLSLSLSVPQFSRCYLWCALCVFISLVSSTSLFEILSTCAYECEWVRSRRVRTMVMKLAANH